MIPKVTIKDLWRTTMRRSTLITIPNLVEFFKFNNEFTEHEVFYGIVRDALDKYQYYYPLYRQQGTRLYVQDNTAKVYDNFRDYLDGKILEDEVFLMPLAVVGIAQNPSVGLTRPLRGFHYEVGEFTDFLFGSGYWYMRCVCNRPFPEDFDEVGVPTDNCAVFFMNKDNDTEYKIFKDQVYVELCRYIWNMKQNMMLQNLPIDVFQGLQEDSQRVQSDLDRIYESAITSSHWII